MTSECEQCPRRIVTVGNSFNLSIFQVIVNSYKVSLENVGNVGFRLHVNFVPYYFMAVSIHSLIVYQEYL